MTDDQLRIEELHERIVCLERVVRSLIFAYHFEDAVPKEELDLLDAIVESELEAEAGI